MAVDKAGIVFSQYLVSIWSINSHLLWFNIGWNIIEVPLIFSYDFNIVSILIEGAKVMKNQNSTLLRSDKEPDADQG